MEKPIPITPCTMEAATKLNESPWRVQPIKVSPYRKDNAEETQAHCILTCPHGDDGINFLEQYPEVLAGVENLQIFEDYITLERDLGTQELTHAIAAHLLELGYSSNVLEIFVPRGVVDFNRLSGFSLRNVSNYKGFREIMIDFLRMHAEVTRQCRNAIDQLVPRGVLLDVHSIAPYSPVNSVSETPANLQEYIDSFINARHDGGFRRPIDLITRIPESPRIADSQLAAAMAVKLKRKNYPFTFDIPYPTGPQILSSEYMMLTRGGAVDIPKDFLTEGTAEDSDYYLLQQKLDSEKVASLAEVIAESLAVCLKQTKTQV